MTQRDLNKIDKTILDNFYKLVHSQENVRLTAALSTYKILTALKKRKPDSFNDHLNYCIERLVTGLASSRALARRGYGTLLLELLKNHQVATERLFTIAQQKYGNISNETTKDNLLAYFLLISIIIESGSFKRGKASSQHIEKMYKHLIQLREMKSYFDYSASKLLSDHHEMFHEALLADVSPKIFGSDVKPSQTEFMVVTLCNKSSPIREFSNLDSAALLNIASTLLDERLHRKPLHPLWIDFSKLVMKYLPQHFEQFCLKIIFPTFFKKNHNELASLGLELISNLLINAEDKAQVNILLSDYVIRLIILSLRTKNSLAKHCNKFFELLCKEFQKSLSGDEINNTTANDRQYAILNRLTSSPGSVAFNEDSKSSSINQLLNNCTSSTLKKYLDKLIIILCKKFAQGESKRLHTACARQIGHIIKRPQMSDEPATTLRVAKFLIVNGFSENKNAESVPESSFWADSGLPKPIGHFDESVRLALVNAYHATMDHLVSTSNTVQRLDSMNDLINFSDQLFTQELVKFIEQGADIPKLWSNFMSALGKHRKLIKKNKEPKLLFPITVLFYFYGLQIIEHGLDCGTQLEELSQCSEEALKNDPSDGTWADVLTDQIIAILSASECSSWIRKLCVSVFGTLLPHITEASIDLLSEAIKNHDDGDDVSDDGDDMDEDGDGIDEEGSDMEKHHNVADDAEEEADEDTLMPSMPVPNDGEEEEYLNDDEMMKFDTVLADMFKLKREKKKKKKQEPAFKLRCLNLLEKALKKHKLSI